PASLPRLGVDDQGIGLGPVGDPELGAAEAIAVADLLGLQLHSDDVAARAGLAHGESADMFAADQLGEILLLLLRVGPAADLVDAEVGGRAVAEADRRGGPGPLFLRH